MIFGAKGEYEKALFHFNRALTINSGYEKARINSDRMKNMLQIQNDGIITMRQKIERDPENPALYYKLGNLYYHIKSYKAAADHYKHALALNPGFPEAIFQLAAVYADLKEYAKSVSAFQQLIAITPDNPLLYYNIACIYARQNRTQNAVTWLKKAIDHGYNNWTHLESDKDLESIRQEPYFRQLINR